MKLNYYNPGLSMLSGLSSVYNTARNQQFTNSVYTLYKQGDSVIIRHEYDNVQQIYCQNCIYVIVTNVSLPGIDIT